MWLFCLFIIVPDNLSYVIAYYGNVYFLVTLFICYQYSVVFGKNLWTFCLRTSYLNKGVFVEKETLLKSFIDMLLSHLKLTADTACVNRCT